MLKKSLVLLTVLAMVSSAQANLLSNGDMEAGDPPTDWGPQNATLSASSDTPDGSSQSLNVVAFDGIDGYAWGATDAGDYADQDLTISFDYKGTGYVRIYDSVSWAVLFADVVSSTEWAYYELTFATSSTLADLYMEVFDNDKIDGTGPLYDNVSIVVIPEPATMTLIGLGGLALIRRRRK